MPYLLINRHFQMTRIFHFRNIPEVQSSSLKLYIFTDSFEVNRHTNSMHVSAPWVKRRFKRGLYPSICLSKFSSAKPMPFPLSDGLISWLLLSCRVMSRRVGPEWWQQGQRGIPRLGIHLRGKVRSF